MTWQELKYSVADACSMLRQVMGSLGYSALLVFGTFVGWYLGGVLMGGVGFLLALGVTFILMDVTNSPTDAECERRREQGH